MARISGHKKNTVMVFGSFDVLHSGHLNLFCQAKKFGQALIVVIARDRTSRRVKGHLPTQSEKDRWQLVSALKIVDQAVLGDLTDQMKVIKKFKPDVVCLGYDQKYFIDQLRLSFPAIKTVRLKAYRPDIYKSSKLINAKITNC